MIKRVMSFMGGVQVQITHSLFYITLGNVVMLSLTFWSTTGLGLLAPVFPWMGAREFLIFVGVLLVLIMLFDYKVVYPYRQAFLNKQTTRYKNPAMDELWAIREHLKELEKKLDELKEAKNG